MRISLEVPHAIIFLYDLSCENVVIPDYSQESIVAANDFCISVGTQAEIDGAVTICLSSYISYSTIEECIKVFQGVINTPSLNIALSTSEMDGILKLDVQSTKTQVSIWIDDPDFPATVLIQAQ